MEPLGPSWGPRWVQIYAPSNRGGYAQAPFAGPLQEEGRGTVQHPAVVKECHCASTISANGAPFVKIPRPLQNWESIHLSSYLLPFCFT